MTFTDIRIALRAGVTADDIRTAHPDTTLGRLAFDRLEDRNETSLHGLPGWPTCDCTGCGCTEPATTCDAQGIPVCEACAEYVCDEDGDVHCSRGDDIETVTECCGAGGQTRRFLRLREA